VVAPGCCSATADPAGTAVVAGRPDSSSANPVTAAMRQRTAPTRVTAAPEHLQVGAGEEVGVATAPTAVTVGPAVPVVATGVEEVTVVPAVTVMATGSESVPAIP
jgi:hypothetical protein